MLVGQLASEAAAVFAALPAGTQLTLGWTLEIEGEAKPACVAESVVLLLG